MCGGGLVIKACLLHAGPLSCVCVSFLREAPRAGFNEFFARRRGGGGGLELGGRGAAAKREVRGIGAGFPAAAVLTNVWEH